MVEPVLMAEQEQSHMGRWITGAIALALMLLMLGLGLEHVGIGASNAVTYDDPDWVAQPAPAVEFTRFDGSVLRLADLRGKVVVLNFWASWCAPCKEEFPLIKELVESFTGEVVVIAISNDDRLEDAQHFAQDYLSPGIEFVWDEQSRLSIEQFAVMRFPESIIIDPEGRMVRKIVGVSAWEDPGLRDDISDLIVPIDV